MSDPPLRRVRWSRAYRILPTRYPPIALFERLADPADWEALAELESLTNDRIREELGDLSMVPIADRVSGPGAGWVMASFVHIGRPSRFSDGSYGVYYCARSLDTAVAETVYHMGLFYAATAEAPLEADMRVLVGGIDATLHDIRNGRKRWRAVYSANSYTRSQVFGRELRDKSSSGLVYDSVRHRDGECLAALRPKAVRLPRDHSYLTYHWNGEKIDRWFDHSSQQWQMVS